MRIALVALLVLAPTAAAQTLTHVRVTDADAEARAAELTDLGYDVVEGSLKPGSFELIGREVDLDYVRDDLGLSVELIARGRPFNEIQAERFAANPDMPPAGYSDLAAIETSMAATAAAFPGICRLVDLTTELGAPLTFEGRSIKALRITDNPTIEEDEPGYLLVSAHHCRELVTPVIALEAIDQLTSNYGTDPLITNLVNFSDIWIIPVFNVDGYNEVFTGDNLWRKNRRILPGGVGVDLNRNYPFGWSSACAGSTVVTSETYKGTAPASEPETQTMMMLTDDQNFARVIDFHSSGREVLWGYDCSSYPNDAWMLAEGIALSVACGYGGSERPPSAEGEHYEWQLARGAHAFLVETHTSFQPTFASAQAEAAQVWGGALWLLGRRAAVAGRLTDLCTDEPVVGSLSIPDFNFVNGETMSSEPNFGRYDIFGPQGTRDIDYAATGYAPQTISTLFPTSSTQNVQDVALDVVATMTMAATMPIDSSIPVQFTSASDPLFVYAGVISLSGTSPGVPVGNCTLPINVDSTTFLPLENPAFQNFFAFLDSNGESSGTFTLPDDNAFIGIEVDFAFFTIDIQTILPRHVSTSAHLLITP